MRSLIERRARTLVVAYVLGFLFATLFPFSIGNPWAVSRVSATAEGGLRFHARSVLLSDPTPAVLDLPECVEGRFSIELAIRAERDDLHGPARIVAYSRDNGIQNWIVGQEERALAVRFRGRKVRFDDSIRPGSTRHFLVSFESGSVTLFRNGARVGTERFQAPPEAWDPRCRLGFGNETTGNRPWYGDLLRFRLYDEPLDEAAARRLHEAFAAEVLSPQDPTLLLEGWAVRERSGRRCSLRIVRWPWSGALKELWTSLGRTPSVRDLVLNTLLALPLGVLVAALLSARRTACVLLSAGVLQSLLSVLVETMQAFSFGRYADLKDVLANVIGAVAGSAAWRLATRRGVPQEPRGAG